MSTQPEIVTEDGISSNPVIDQSDTVNGPDELRTSAWNNKCSHDTFNKILTSFNDLIERYTPSDDRIHEFRDEDYKTEDLLAWKGSVMVLEKAIHDAKTKNFDELISLECSSLGGNDGSSQTPYATREQWVPRRRSIIQRAKIDNFPLAYLEAEFQEFRGHKPYRSFARVNPTEKYEPRILFEQVLDVLAFAEADWISTFKKEMATERKKLKIKSPNVRSSLASVIVSKLCCVGSAEDFERGEYPD